MKPSCVKRKKRPMSFLWDGGNNDFPFYKPDLMVTVVDPTARARTELLPG
jgi:predicted GTPase